MRAALVRNGLVVQAVELASDWEGKWAPPPNTTIVPSLDAGIGWTYDGAAFTPPPPNPDPPPSDPIDAVDRVLMIISFNHENRIRALEGKAAVTLAQYKSFLRTMLT